MTAAERIARIDAALDDPRNLVSNVLDLALWRTEVEDEASQFVLALMALREVAQ